MDSSYLEAKQKAEHHINAQAFFISRVMEASPDIIHIADLHSGTVVYINKMMLQELGYAAEDIRTRGLDKKFNELYHPDDLEHVNEFKSKIATADDDELVEMEARVKARNGSWQWIRTRAKIFQR